MDRLSLVMAALTLLAACDEAKSAPPASRVVAVSQAKKEASEAELCDVLKSADAAPAFVYPALMGTTPAPATVGRNRWINVWATWCPPCVEELPLLTRFRETLLKEGTEVELSFLSVDATPEVVEKFAAAHPEALGSLQVKDSAALEAWLPKVGLDSHATLPIHLFVDAQGKVRCARTGAVRESDLPRVRKLLAGG